ncbi:MAG: rhodanese-like domain-containing protein [Planctomycetota bacterium]|jgi:rhodanese-related sulfurtransferase
MSLKDSLWSAYGKAYKAVKDKSVRATPQEAAEQLEAGDAILLDVREEGELVETGVAKGAVWVPTSAIQQEAEAWKAFRDGLPKGQRVYAFCAAGVRSGKVCELLDSLGIEARNIGGFKDWAGAGLPVEAFRPKGP